jgi:hypothetical protein
MDFTMAVTHSSLCLRQSYAFKCMTVRLHGHTCGKSGRSISQGSSTIFGRGHFIYFFLSGWLGFRNIITKLWTKK